MTNVQRILIRLGLLEGEPDNKELIDRAVSFALNGSGYSLTQYYPIPLRPTLEAIVSGKNEHYIIPEALSIDIKMPVNAAIDSESLENYFHVLKLKLDKCPQHNLVNVLEIWGSSLAFSEQYQDISLFDFVKTVAGIADALMLGNDKLRLAGCSISGIQTYLYEIISKNASKLLKGRSLYIQLLLDSILQEALDFFCLNKSNVIYASGGGFYFIVSDDDDIDKKFSAFSRNISDAIFRKHKTGLFVDFALTESFDESVNVSEIWDTLFIRLKEERLSRLSRIPAFWDSFFDFSEFGGTKDRDEYTNEEISDGDAELINGVKVSKITRQQIELGKDLRKANYWISSKEKVYKRETIVDPLGRYHYFEEALGKMAPSDNLDIYTVNDTSLDVPFIFYGGNVFPVFKEDIRGNDGNMIHGKGDIMTFDYVAESNNIKRLAILRMDVDGLGAIFSAGFHENLSSNWCRYSSVSRSLDLFFKGFLNKLYEKYSENSAIIYSGGDDLFIVGRWDNVLKFSIDIKDHFKKWSCGKLTISGGIELFTSKFPIMQGAKLTSESEKNAKNHSVPSGQKKNSISMLGYPLNWDTEFPVVLELHKRITDLLNKDEPTKSFLGKINMYVSLATDKDSTSSFRWRWIATYDLSRYLKELRSQTALNFVKEISICMFSDIYDGKKIDSKYSFLILLQIACRWSELESRSSLINK